MASDPQIDLKEFVLRPTGSQKTLDVAKQIVDATLTRTLGDGDTASEFTLEVTISDPAWDILTCGIFDLDDNDRLDAIDVQVDDVWFRLVKISTSENQLTLTFELRYIAWLRQHDKPIKASRNKSTRSEFVRRLIKEVKGGAIPFYSPELHKKQAVTSGTEEAAHDKHSSGPADDADFKIKGQKPNKDQRRNVSIVLQVCDDLNVRALIRKAIIIAGIAESSFSTHATQPRTKAEGVFQLLPSTAASTGLDPHDTEATARHWIQTGYGAAGSPEDIIKANPGISAGRVAEKVEATDGSNYDQFSDEADKIIKVGGGYQGSSYAQSFEFARGSEDTKEDSWQTIARLKGEVNWSGFFDDNAFIFMAESSRSKGNVNTLVRATPIATIDASGPEVLHRPTFDIDQGKDVAQVTLTINAHRWSYPPGAVVALTNAGPGNGRWLIDSNIRSLFDTSTELILRKPLPPKNEPAHTLGSRSSSTKDSTGSHDGKWKILSGANRAGIGLTDQMESLLDDVATFYDGTLVVSTGTNHNQYVKDSHRQSNHWTGNAADLGMAANGGTDDGPVGDKIAIAAMRTCGLSYNDARSHVPDWTQFNHTFHWKGHVVEIGWRTDVGGNHHNHVHIGISGS